MPDFQSDRYELYLNSDLKTNNVKLNLLIVDMVRLLVFFLTEFISFLEEIKASLIIAEHSNPPSEFENWINIQKHLLSKNRMESVFMNLKKSLECEDDRKNDIFIILYSRHTANEEMNIQGLIRYERYILERHMLTAALLKFLDILTHEDI